MTDNDAYPFEPDWRIPVGEVLCETLFELGLSFLDVASTLGMSLEQFRDSVYGKSDFTPELAEGLETVTNVPAKFWLRLDEVYRKRENGNDRQTGENN